MDTTEDRRCEVDIHITSQGDVNIYNCATVPTQQPLPVPGEPAQCPPTLPPTGACVSLALGSKPKQSLQAKLGPFLERNQVPSVLAASSFHMARRFLRGRSPANALETEVFSVLQSLAPALREIVACSLRTFDALSPSDRDRLFAAEVAGGDDQPIDPARFAELVVNELVQRTSIATLGDPGGFKTERPGQLRVIGSGETVAIPITICRLNGLRTNTFIPLLSLGEYTPDELEQQCTLEIIDGEVHLNCQVQTANCPGNAVDGTCLRVPEVQAGDVVTLQGINFFNIQTRVRLEAQPPGTAIREVEAHVFGDVTIPPTIVDCTVQDILTFSVPEDLPVGIYGITVIVPNNTGLPGFGEELESSGLQFIKAIPPETATFQIASETLHAVKETAPAFFGSDEVGISIVAIPVGPDLTPGDAIEHKFRFGDVDSGESRTMSRVLFQQGNIGGVSLAIIGFEIDSEEAFERQLDSVWDAYIEILKSSGRRLLAL
jgi:hypothetical protein